MCDRASKRSSSDSPDNRPSRGCSILTSSIGFVSGRAWPLASSMRLILGFRSPSPATTQAGDPTSRRLTLTASTRSFRTRLIFFSNGLCSSFTASWVIAPSPSGRLNPSRATSASGLPSYSARLSTSHGSIRSVSNRTSIPFSRSCSRCGLAAAVAWFSASR